MHSERRTGDERSRGSRLLMVVILAGIGLLAALWLLVGFQSSAARARPAMQTAAPISATVTATVKASAPMTDAVTPPTAATPTPTQPTSPLVVQPQPTATARALLPLDELMAHLGMTLTIPLPVTATLTAAPAVTTTLVITDQAAVTTTVVTSSTADAAGPTTTTPPETKLILVPTPTPVAMPSPAAPIAAGRTISPLPTPDGVNRSARVPVLMYHYLSTPPADADIYRQDLSVAPALFAEHLDMMLAAGYTTITPYQLLDHLVLGEALPEKPVLITFDDGYRDNYENAFPLLRERGMQATFFIVTDFIDEERPAYLTWDMVREMYAAGMSIESHGRNHATLRGRDDDYLVWQALGSLETIEYELGVRPHFVSYPAGEYDQRTMDLFASAHYWAGFTTVQGATHRSDDLFQLHRVRVRNTTSATELLRLLELDW